LLVDVPWRAAEAGIAHRSVICPTGMLRWRVETRVAYVSTINRHAEGLDSTVEVHVKQSILIVPDSSGRICHFVGHEPMPIDFGLRFKLSNCCARICPCLDSGLHSHSVTGLVKYEIGRAATDSKLFVREIVKHVALVSLLAPGEFMRSDIR